MARGRRRTPVANDPGNLLAAKLKNASKKPNNNLYIPHEKQLLFHSSPKIGRQYIGGNRSGKTVGGINEDIYWLRGQHPFRKVPEPPVIGRLTTVDFKNGVYKIILPNLKQWIPPSLLINGSWEDSWDNQQHTLYLSNGSELELMSYEQELDEFAGVPRHFIHFDEEPDKDIFEECKARLVDYGGSWWMTMTPVEGMTWTEEEIYEPSVDGKNPLIDIIQVSTYDNRMNLAEGAIDTMMEGYSDDKKKIRGEGKYVSVTGTVFENLDPDVHFVDSWIPPASWTHWMSLDAGFNNPTAVEFHAVSPSGIVVTYYEHYKALWTIEQHAKKILEIEDWLRREHKITLFQKVADPAIKQRSGVTGLSTQIEYMQHGVVLATPTSRDVKAGLDKMNNYFRTEKWFITSDCPNLRREARRYRWAGYASSKVTEKNNKQDKPQKKDDHSVDSARYFFSFLPDINLSKLPQNDGTGREELRRLMAAGTTYDPRQPFPIDRELMPPVAEEAHFIRSYDETVGEY